MKAIIRREDGSCRVSLEAEQLRRFRVQSEVFNLFFPQDNVYGVKTGETRSVCDGFWIFIKPLPPGRYFIYFRGLTFLAETFTQNSMKNLPVYANTREQIDRNLFGVEVLYKIAHQR